MSAALPLDRARRAPADPDVLSRPWAGALAVGSLVATLAFAVVLAVHYVQIDITVYLAGGRHFFASDLYSLHAPGSGLLFTYPPFAAMLFVPLAHLPALVARLIWGVVDTAALAGLIFVSVRTVRPAWPAARTWRVALLCTAPAALLNPVFVTFQLGQVNLVLALLVAADLLRPEPAGGAGVAGTGAAGEGAAGGLGGAARGVGLVALLPEGLLVGVAAAVKLTPLILVPYLLLIGKRRAAAWAAGTFVVCGALAAALSPVSSWRYWTKAAFQSGRAGNLTYISDQNLRSILERFHHGALPGAVVWPVAALLCAAGLALAVVAYRRSSPLLGLLVCVTTGLLVSPITWVHHLVWVVPAVAWLAAAPDRPAFGRVAAASTVILFWAGPVWWVPNNNLHEWHESAWQLAAGNSFFFAMAAFLAAAAVVVLRRRKPARTPSLP